MTGVAFSVLDARPERYAAEPTLVLRLAIEELDGRAVHALALKCQIRIEPQRRRYAREEEQRLVEMFGETPQWADSLRPFLWTHVSTVVSAFDGSTEVDLHVPCTYDFEVAASKYLHSLADGVVPLVLCFSGSSFTVEDGRMHLMPVSWSSDATFLLPVATWRETMDLYFPNSGWMRVSRETLDALTRYKAERALPTWDLTLERLAKEAGIEW